MNQRRLAFEQTGNRQALASYVAYELLNSGAGLRPRGTQLWQLRRFFGTALLPMRRGGKGGLRLRHFHRSGGRAQVQMLSHSLHLSLPLSVRRRRGQRQV